VLCSALNFKSHNEIEPEVRFTTIGSAPIIKPAAIFKHTTSSYLERRMPNNAAPTIYSIPQKGEL